MALLSFEHLAPDEIRAVLDLSRAPSRPQALPQRFSAPWIGQNGIPRRKLEALIEESVNLMVST